MLPYYVLLLLPLWIRTVPVKGFDSEKKNKYSLTLFFGILLFMLMFRHETVGNDTRNYIYFFETIARTSLSNIRVFIDEFTFVRLNKLVSFISTDPQVWLAISSLIIILLIAPTIIKGSKDASLTIVLYCTLSTFVMAFSGIRQMLSVGIGVLAYRFVKDKKLLPFILCVVLAFTIHNSAFMIMFMYPLFHAKITKKWLFFVIPGMGAIFVFNNQIFTFLLGILNSFTRYDSKITTTGAYMMIVVFVLFSIFAYLVPDESMLDDETHGLRNFLLFATMLQFFAPVHSLAMRMNYYYIIFIPILMPKIIEYRSARWNEVAIWGRNCMFIFFLIYFFVSAEPGGGLNTFPYHFFWETVQ